MSLYLKLFAVILFHTLGTVTLPCHISIDTTGTLILQALCPITFSKV